ncbi:hypothetical protein CLOM621_06751 [Clostridium sp. M62/1]|nr:hypothetical protein CLOM621_06751 [Clostridium sp. M62/1]
MIRYNASLRAARKFKGNLKGFRKASKKKIKKVVDKHNKL